MQTFIGAKLLSSQLAQPTQKPFEIYDNRLAGFTLRVQPTGVRSYYARFGRNRRYSLGKVDRSVFSTTYSVAPVAIGTTEHKEAVLSHAKLTQAAPGVSVEIMPLPNRFRSGILLPKGRTLLNAGQLWNNCA